MKALERIRQSDAVKRLRMDVDPEAAKECGRLAEQVRRSGVAEYTPMWPVENYLVACPLKSATQYKPL